MEWERKEGEQKRRKRKRKMKKRVKEEETGRRKRKEGREKAGEEEEEVEGLIRQLILKLQLDLIGQNVKVLCILCLKNVTQMF